MAGGMGAGPVNGSTDGGLCARTRCGLAFTVSACCAVTSNDGRGDGAELAAAVGRDCDAAFEVPWLGPRTAAAAMPAARTAMTPTPRAAVERWRRQLTY